METFRSWIEPRLLCKGNACIVSNESKSFRTKTPEELMREKNTTDVDPTERAF